MARSRPLRPAAFRRWLEKLPHQTRFTTNSLRKCPIARYVRGLASQSWCAPNSCFSGPGPGGLAVRIKTPAWASAFIEAIDDRAKSGPFPEKVSVKHALKVLLTVAYR